MRDFWRREQVVAGVKGNCVVMELMETCMENVGDVLAGLEHRASLELQCRSTWCWEVREATSLPCWWADRAWAL